MKSKTCACTPIQRLWNGYGSCLRCGLGIDADGVVEHDHYLLELFEQGDGPIDTGIRHAVWLHVHPAGDFYWRCSCGVSTALLRNRGLDDTLLADARRHFEQAWDPAAVPIGHPLAIWNDRVLGKPPPSTADLAQLAAELLGKLAPLPRPAKVVNRCGICGEDFQISEDDPHWSTGRGPLCPKEART